MFIRRLDQRFEGGTTSQARLQIEKRVTSFHTVPYRAEVARLQRAEPRVKHKHYFSIRADTASLEKAQLLLSVAVSLCSPDLGFPLSPSVFGPRESWPLLSPVSCYPVSFLGLPAQTGPLSGIQSCMNQQQPVCILSSLPLLLQVDVCVLGSRFNLNLFLHLFQLKLKQSENVYMSSVV